MTRNDFERLCSLYLRLNGFFHIAGFTLHYTDANAEEIDFLGVRFPGSKEIPYSKRTQSFKKRHVFEDDAMLLDMIDDSKITLLIGEATMSIYRRQINNRIDKLRNPDRIKYALQRFGNAVQDIDNSHSTTNVSILKIIFLLSKKLISNRVESYDIHFVSYHQITSFLKKRAANVVKPPGKALLPQGLQEVITFIQSQKLDNT